MRILLDTHIMLWALTGDPHLPDKARRLIEDSRNEICYSILSLWEIELKHSIHPDQMPVTAQDVEEYCRQSGYQQVLLRGQHIYRLPGLMREPRAVPHKDPFDRMLICQAAVEDMLLITHDKRIAEYLDPCIIPV